MDITGQRRDRGVHVRVSVDPQQTDTGLVAGRPSRRLRRPTQLPRYDRHPARLATRRRGEGRAIQALAHPADFLNVSLVRVTVRLGLDDRCLDIALVHHAITKRTHPLAKSGDPESRRPHVDPASARPEVEGHADNVDLTHGSPSR